MFFSEAERTIRKLHDIILNVMRPDLPGKRVGWSDAPGLALTTKLYVIFRCGVTKVVGRSRDRLNPSRGSIKIHVNKFDTRCAIIHRNKNCTTKNDDTFNNSKIAIVAENNINMNDIKNAPLWRQIIINDNN